MKETKIASRKKFLVWSAITVVSAAAIKLFSSKKELPKPTTIKMLAQDGSLVEIDQNLLIHGKKITNDELKVWVKK